MPKSFTALMHYVLLVTLTPKSSFLNHHFLSFCTLVLISYYPDLSTLHHLLMLIIMLLVTVIEGVHLSTSFPLCSLKDNNYISYLNVLLALLLILLLVMQIYVAPSHNVDIENCSLWYSCLL